MDLKHKLQGVLKYLEILSLKPYLKLNMIYISV